MNTLLIITLILLWTILIACDIIFGRILKFYDKTKWFDLALHTYGGALMVLTTFLFFDNHLSLPTIWIIFLSFCVSMTASVLLEFIEFASDRLFDTNGQRWKDGYNEGLIDTMTDLLAAASGSVVICLILAIVI